MEPLIITGSRAKTAIYLAISIVFVAVGVLMVGHPSGAKDLIYSWLSIVFFGLGVVVFGWLLVRPQVLQLDSEGFSLGGGLVRTPRKTRWRDVQAFFVFRLPRGGKMIGFNYEPGRRPSLASVSRRFGADGGLPKSWPKSPEAMADILNGYRERALAFESRWTKVES